MSHSIEGAALGPESKENQMPEASPGRIACAQVRCVDEWNAIWTAVHASGLGNIGNGPPLQPCPQATVPAPHSLQGDATPLDTLSHYLETPPHTQRTLTHTSKDRYPLQSPEHLYTLQTRSPNAWAPYPDTPETPRTPEGSRHRHTYHRPSPYPPKPPTHEAIVHHIPPVAFCTIIAHS